MKNKILFYNSTLALIFLFSVFFIFPVYSASLSVDLTELLINEKLDIQEEVSSIINEKEAEFIIDKEYQTITPYYVNEEIYFIDSIVKWCGDTVPCDQGYQINIQSDTEIKQITKLNNEEITENIIFFDKIATTTDEKF